MQKDSRELLTSRATAFAKCRQFFTQRDIVEVDTALMSPYAPVDLHLDPLQGTCCGSPAYFHTSPEYAMKRLLAEGSGDIYQLGHVYRDGEVGRIHRPEFTMLEWYRVGFSLEQMMEETCQVAELFLGEKEREYLSYKEAFERFVNINPFIATMEELRTLCRKYHCLCEADSSRDDLLDQLLTALIEPHLGKKGLTLLHSYPASQAALARTSNNEGDEIAKRFELYHKGIELANGYHELASSSEQAKRLATANQQRLDRGKEALPIDKEFVNCLDQLPDCCGVAVGFDRLFMLQLEKYSLSSCLPLDSHYIN